MNAKRIVLTLVSAVVVWLVLTMLVGLVLGISGASSSSPLAAIAALGAIPLSLWYCWRQTGQWQAKKAASRA